MKAGFFIGPIRTKIEALKKMNLLKIEIERLVQMALAEDLPWGDVTSDTLLLPEWQAQGKVIAKAEGVWLDWC